ncbi:MAG: hypothetical protein IVW54_21065 [Candidatus Binataceae bacterium]|nr:hypothetical protein [Candidatus Binataceae bacterium]
MSDLPHAHATRAGRRGVKLNARLNSDRRSSDAVRARRDGVRIPIATSGVTRGILSD